MKLARYRSNSLAQYAGSAGRTLMRAAVRSAFKRKRSFGGNTANKQRKFANPPLVTGENDWSNVYNRRRMPARKRKPWVRFVRKTKAVIGKQLAPSFLVRVRTGSITAAANKQKGASIHTILGGFSSNQDTQDLSAINDRVQTLQPVVASTFALSGDRFMVTGWMAETQIVANSDNATACYIDMYYWRCQRNVGVSTVNPALNTSIESLWSHDLQNQGVNAPAAGSGLDTDDYGVTPFQTTSFPKYVNIYKKRRVRLGPGATVQVEQRSGRNYYVNVDYTRSLGMIRGMTEGIYFITYGVPTPTNAVSAPCTVRFSTNINYTYRFLMNSASTGGTTQA